MLSKRRTLKKKRVLEKKKGETKKKEKKELNKDKIAVKAIISGLKMMKTKKLKYRQYIRDLVPKIRENPSKFLEEMLGTHLRGVKFVENDKALVFSLPKEEYERVFGIYSGGLTLPRVKDSFLDYGVVIVKEGPHMEDTIKHEIVHVLDLRERWNYKKMVEKAKKGGKYVGRWMEKIVLSEIAAGLQHYGNREGSIALLDNYIRMFGSALPKSSFLITEIKKKSNELVSRIQRIVMKYREEDISLEEITHILINVKTLDEANIVMERLDSFLENGLFSKIKKELEKHNAEHNNKKVQENKKSARKH